MSKVCHMTSVRSSRDYYIFDRVCRSSVNLGYDTFLIAKGNSREDRGVHVIGIGDAPLNRLQRMFSFTRKIYNRALSINADIYHIYDPEMLPYAMKLVRQGKVVVFDSRELYSVLIRSKDYLPFSGLLAKLYSSYEKYVFKHLDAVLFPSTINGKNIFDGISERNVLLANYPVLEEFDEIRSHDEIECSMCYVGTMTPDRKIEQMVDVACMSGCVLHLIGDFIPESYGVEVMRRSTGNLVIHHHAMERKESLELMAKCSLGLCIIPNGGQYNIADTFNMKVYDYMALGLPVILSKSAYADRVLSSYEFGVTVDPSNLFDIIDTVKKLLNDSEKRCHMGENGKRAVQEYFNWRTQEKILGSLYRDLLM